MIWLVLAGALTATALAQVSYKAYFSRSRRLALLATALGLFVVAQLGFLVALTDLEVGVVYMSMGLVQVMVLVLSYTVLRERITPDHIVAVALIVGGLVLYAA